MGALGGTGTRDVPFKWYIICIPAKHLHIWGVGIGWSDIGEVSHAGGRVMWLEAAV